MLKGGDAFNVIPESVTIGGTFRSMTDQGLSFLMKRVKEVNENEHYFLASIWNGFSVSIYDAFPAK